MEEFDMKQDREELTPEPLRILKRDAKHSPQAPQVPQRIASKSSASTSFSNRSSADEEGLWRQLPNLQIPKRPRNYARNLDENISTNIAKASNYKMSSISTTETDINMRTLSNPALLEEDHRGSDSWSFSPSVKNASRLESNINTDGINLYQSMVLDSPITSTSSGIRDLPRFDDETASGAEPPNTPQQGVKRRTFSTPAFFRRFSKGADTDFNVELQTCARRVSPGGQLPHQACSASIHRYTDRTLRAPITEVNFHNVTHKKTISYLNSPAMASASRSSLETYQAAPPVHERTTPQENAILGAQLTTTSERNFVSIPGIENGNSLYVAVEIKGFVGSPGHGSEGSDESNALDIAIIVDNSLYTSPASLLTSCDIASKVAASLHKSEDRFSIFQTSLSNGSSQWMEPVYPLCRLAQGQVKAALDSITVSASPPQRDYLVDTIKKAQVYLMETARGHSQISYSHIVLLTGNIDAIPETAQDWEHGLHVICPSMVPRQIKPANNGAGWRLHAHPQASGFAQSVPPGKSKSLNDEIHNMIFDLRQNTRANTMTDLRLSIQSTPYCSIEDVMGRTMLPILRPGENHIVMVKVKAHSNQISTDLANALGPFDSKNDIHAKFQEQPVRLLKVKLEYTQSGLPRETVCRTAKNVEVKLRGPHGHHRSTSSGKSALHYEKLIEMERYVRSRLIFHVATQHSAAHALQTIVEQFGSEDTLHPMKEYRDLTIAELKHQSRIDQRLGFANDQPGRAEYRAERTSTILRQAKYDGTARDLATLVMSDEDKLSFVSGNFSDAESEDVASRSDQASVSTSDERTNKAKQIWGSIRRLSRGESNQQDEATKAWQNRVSQESLQQIKQSALKNKRSMGEDTLHSIVNEEHRKENVSPWL